VKLVETKIHLEATRYIIVGLCATLIDVILFNLMIASKDLWDVRDISFIAKCVSTTVAVCVAYLGHKYWTFRDRTGSNSARSQVGLFVIVNAIGLGIALACLWVSRYVFGFSSQLADNISANFIGLILGTAFRFLASRQFVFTK